ncbi:hypothetical protein BV25DRAFT_1819310 [Artomyces pyxidatus]|uniref:Uncharacterized protein n=1 Tax=Artomyces pyxidatus TaxID=48021 RepID=A0ACB8THK5_9AGAM|nr:hypothetical protein BV25DRAFT_1819310 [Artomyces pyxidatus]
MSSPRQPHMLWSSASTGSFAKYRRPSLSLIPLVLVQDAQDPVRTPAETPHRYRFSRTSIILSAFGFAVLVLVAIFLAIFTSFVQAQEAAAAAASSSAAASARSS